MNINAISSSESLNQEKEVKKLNQAEKYGESIFDTEGKSQKISEISELEDTGNNEVTLKEGASLLAKGAIDKVKSMGKAIVEHPLRTVATVVGTSALVMAAPVIGISTATAGSFLAIGFGIYSAAKTAKDVVETVKDNNEGRYDEVREDLSALGGDGLDLALTLPFMPKAINQVTRFAKYGTSTVGLNTELLSNIAKSGNITKEIAKADTAINYEMIANEMGLAAKPELVFTSKTPDGTGAFYEPAEGKMVLNERFVKLGSSLNEEILRHELQHYQQFCDIAKVYGEEGLKSAVSDYYSAIVKQSGASTATPDADVAAIDAQIKENYENWNTSIELNKNADLNTRLRDASYYLTNSNSLEEQQISAVAQYKGYINAVDKISEESGISYKVIENMTNGDKSVFNSELYQKMASSNTSTYTTSDLQRVESYLAGFKEKTSGTQNLEAVQAIFDKYGIPQDVFAQIVYSNLPISNYQKAMLEIYKLNPLESEAYAAQGAFKSEVLNLRPTFLSNECSQLALTEEEINSYTEDKNIKDVVISDEPLSKKLSALNTFTIFAND